MRKKKTTIKSEDKLTLGKWFKELREKKNISQLDASLKLRMGHYQFISKIENEKRIPPMRVIKPMADLYGVTDLKIRVEIVKYLLSKLKEKYGLKK